MFRRRGLKLTNLVWQTENARLRDEIRALAADPENHEKFGLEYLKRAADARMELEKRQNRISITSSVLVAALFMLLFTGTTEISILGISIKGFKEAREFLLIVSVALNLTSGMIQVSVGDLRIIQQSILEVIYPEPIEQRLINATLPHLFGNHLLFARRRSSQVHYSILSMVVLLISTMIGFATLIILLMILTAIQIAAWWQTFQHPNFPEPWNAIILGITAAGIFGSISYQIFRHVRLPYRDYTLVSELDHLWNTNKEAHKNRIDELIAEQSHRD